MSDKILDDIIAKVDREEEERKAKEKQTVVYSKDAQEKIKQRPPVHGGALYEEGQRQTLANNEGFIAGKKQDPELREEVREKAKASGLPDREADYTVDRAYAQGFEKSDGPTPKPTTTASPIITTPHSSPTTPTKDTCLLYTSPSPRD